MKRAAGLLLLLAWIAGVSAYSLDDPTADHTAHAIEMDTRGDMAAAIRSFRSAVKFAPRSAEAWNNLGIALQEPGNPTVEQDAAEAQRCERKAASLEEDAESGGSRGGGDGGADDDGDGDGDDDDDDDDAHGIPKAPIVRSDTTGAFRFYNELLPWEEAKAFCEQQGGQLATLDSQHKSNLAATKCKSKRCWIGLNDRDREGEHVWVDGATPGFTRWLKYEPNNAYAKEPTQNCCYIWGGEGRAGYGRDGQWGDGECERLMPFLCDITGGGGGKKGGNAKAVSSGERKVPGMVDGKCTCRPRQALPAFEAQAKCHTELSRPQIDEDLGIWASAAREPNGPKITREYMDETIKKGHLHFIIRGGRLYSRVPPGTGVPYLRDDWVAFLQAMLRNVDVPDVEFAVQVLDRPKALKHDYFPVFHHVKTDSHAEILVPHPWHYLDLLNIDESEHENRDMSTKNEDFETWLFPWKSKVDKLVWRGSANGGEMQPYNWRFYPRNKLVALGKAHPKQIDAGYSDVQVLSQFMQEQIKHLKKDFKGYMWEPEWQKNRYIGVVDGIGMSIRYAGVMMTNSVPVKQTSPYYEFYYRWLEPMKHYVPFNYSMNDLVDRVKWLQAHPDRAKSIAYEGSRFMREIYTTNEVICYMARVLDGFSKLLDYKPRPDARFDAHADYECPC